MSDLRKYSGSAANAVLERIGRGVSQVQERGPPAHNLLRFENTYLVIFDTPGAHTEDMQVRSLGDGVEIRIDRFRNFHEDYEIHFPGRGLTLSGAVTIPSGASIGVVEGTATVGKHGALRIQVPKDERASGIAVTEEEDETDGEADTGSDDEVGFGDVDDQDA